jgi:uncharacterized membrane protein (UPF0127 family)
MDLRDLLRVDALKGGRDVPALPDISSRRHRRAPMLAVAALLIAVTASLSLSVIGKPHSRSVQDKGELTFTKNGQLTFISTKNKFLVSIDIEIADTPEKRSLGLMYRTSLGELQGMLFIFDEEDYQSFWMKNTPLSLDMIFVSARNEIVTIHENTTPYSPESYSSTKPAQFVIEVNAGFVKKFGIQVGDRIRWQKR